mmetsp:Transcript_1738/g.2499  ORF Transcript_1738/g.2499 Transcript_1738/m.2499 type:complete len:98 (-) Transcript_1738:581-874(-)
MRIRSFRCVATILTFGFSESFKPISTSNTISKKGTSFGSNKSAIFHPFSITANTHVNNRESMSCLRLSSSSFGGQECPEISTLPMKKENETCVLALG